MQNAMVAFNKTRSRVADEKRGVEFDDLCVRLNKKQASKQKR